MTTTLTLDALAAVKEKQQATWASGNYAVIGTTLQIIGERLCEAVDVSAGSTGARRGRRQRQRLPRRRPPRLRRHRHRLRRAPARAGPPSGPTPRGSRSPPQVADAEDLPVRGRQLRRRAVDRRRDVHAEPRAGRGRARPRRAAPAAASVWPTGPPRASSARCSRSSAPHVPPPAGVPSPLQWGTDDRLEELLGADCDVEIDPPPLRLPLPLGRGLLRDVQGRTTARS